MADSPLVIDQVIGNFRVLSLLGSGGMGDVYLAEHQGIQTRVAIKMLQAQISRDADHVQRFFNEARIVSKIKHAGIVKIFDVGFHEHHATGVAGDRRAYLVMELLEGESLAARIQRGRMSMAETADIAYQIASTLAATHNAGIVHRDLKPDNIYLVPDDELGRPRVKILDFGIAKLGGTLSGGPRTIGTMGTPAYMAPEQWGDSGSVDWRADAYSLGCVVFEMIAGRPPFAASTITEAFKNHTQAPPPSARSIVADVPAAADELILRLLAKHAPERAASTASIAHAFDALRVSIDPDAQWTTATQPHAPRISREHRAATTLGASAAQVGITPVRGNKKLMLAGMFAGLIVAIAATTVIVRGAGGNAPTAAATQPPPPPAAVASEPAPAVTKDPISPPSGEPTGNRGLSPDSREPTRVVEPVKVKPAAARPTTVRPPAKQLSPTTTPRGPAAPPNPAPKSELEDRT